MVEVNDFIDQVINQDFAKAVPTFNDIMSSKMDDALEQEKISVAGQIFNGEEPDEEQLELDLDDENEEEYTEYEFDDAELDDAAEEAMEEEDNEDEE